MRLFALMGRHRHGIALGVLLLVGTAAIHSDALLRLTASSTGVPVQDEQIPIEYPTAGTQPKYCDGKAYDYVLTPSNPSVDVVITISNYTKQSDSMPFGFFEHEALIANDACLPISGDVPGAVSLSCEYPVFVVDPEHELTKKVAELTLDTEACDQRKYAITHQNKMEGRVGFPPPRCGPPGCNWANVMVGCLLPPPLPYFPASGPKYFDSMTLVDCSRPVDLCEDVNVTFPSGTTIDPVAGPTSVPFTITIDSPYIHNTTISTSSVPDPGNPLNVGAILPNPHALNSGVNTLSSFLTFSTGTECVPGTYTRQLNLSKPVFTDSAGNTVSCDKTVDLTATVVCSEEEEEEEQQNNSEPGCLTLSVAPATITINYDGTATAAAPITESLNVTVTGETGDLNYVKVQVDDLATTAPFNISFNPIGLFDTTSDGLNETGQSMLIGASGSETATGQISVHGPCSDGPGTYTWPLVIKNYQVGDDSQNNVNACSSQVVTLSVICNVDEENCSPGDDPPDGKECFELPCTGPDTGRFCFADADGKCQCSDPGCSAPLATPPQCAESCASEGGQARQCIPDGDGSCTCSDPGGPAPPAPNPAPPDPAPNPAPVNPAPDPAPPDPAPAPAPGGPTPGCASISVAPTIINIPYDGSATAASPLVTPYIISLTSPPLVNNNVKMEFPDTITAPFSVSAAPSSVVDNMSDGLSDPGQAIVNIFGGTVTINGEFRIHGPCPPEGGTFTWPAMVKNYLNAADASTNTNACGSAGITFSVQCASSGPPPPPPPPPVSTPPADCRTFTTTPFTWSDIQYDGTGMAAGNELFGISPPTGENTVLKISGVTVSPSPPFTVTFSPFGATTPAGEPIPNTPPNEMNVGVVVYNGPCELGTTYTVNFDVSIYKESDGSICASKHNVVQIKCDDKKTTCDGIHLFWPPSNPEHTQCPAISDCPENWICDSYWEDNPPPGHYPGWFCSCQCPPDRRQEGEECVCHDGYEEDADGNCVLIPSCSDTDPGPDGANCPSVTSCQDGWSCTFLNNMCQCQPDILCVDEVPNEVGQCGGYCPGDLVCTPLEGGCTCATGPCGMQTGAGYNTCGGECPPLSECAMFFDPAIGQNDCRCECEFTDPITGECTAEGPETGDPCDECDPNSCGNCSQENEEAGLCTPLKCNASGQCQLDCGAAQVGLCHTGYCEFGQSCGAITSDDGTFTSCGCDGPLDPGPPLPQCLPQCEDALPDDYGNCSGECINGGICELQADYTCGCSGGSCDGGIPDSDGQCGGDCYDPTVYGCYPNDDNVCECQPYPNPNDPCDPGIPNSCGPLQICTSEGCKVNCENAFVCSDGGCEDDLPCVEQPDGTCGCGGDTCTPSDALSGFGSLPGTCPVPAPPPPPSPAGPCAISFSFEGIAKEGGVVTATETITIADGGSDNVAGWEVSASNGVLAFNFPKQTSGGGVILEGEANISIQGSTFTGIGNDAVLGTTSCAPAFEIADQYQPDGGHDTIEYDSNSATLKSAVGGCDDAAELTYDTSCIDPCTDPLALAAPTKRRSFWASLFASIPPPPPASTVVTMPAGSTPPTWSPALAEENTFNLPGPDFDIEFTIDNSLFDDGGEAVLTWTGNLNPSFTYGGGGFISGVSLDSVECNNSLTVEYLNSVAEEGPINYDIFTLVFTPCPGVAPPPPIPVSTPAPALPPPPPPSPCGTESDIADSNLVITSTNGFTVAIDSDDGGTCGSIVAIGGDERSDDIIGIARRSDIAITENDDLARRLYDAGVGRELEPEQCRSFINSLSSCDLNEITKTCGGSCDPNHSCQWVPQINDCDCIENHLTCADHHAACGSYRCPHQEHECWKPPNFPDCVCAHPDQIQNPVPGGPCETYNYDCGLGDCPLGSMCTSVQVGPNEDDLGCGCIQTLRFCSFMRGDEDVDDDEDTSQCGLGFCTPGTECVSNGTACSCQPTSTPDSAGLFFKDISTGVSLDPVESTDYEDAVEDVANRYTQRYLDAVCDRKAEEDAEMEDYYGFLACGGQSLPGREGLKRITCSVSCRTRIEPEV